MNSKNFFKEYVKSIIGLIFILCIAALLALHLFFKDYWNATLVDVLSSLLTAIMASFCIGAFFDLKVNHKQLTFFSKIFEVKEAYYSSGFVKYYDSIDEVSPDLSNSIKQSENISIYFAYGYSALNRILKDISTALEKADSIVNVYLMHPDNPFIEGYYKLWGYSEKKGLIARISESENLLKDTIKELRKKNKLKGKINLCKVKKYPVHYSFYMCDNELYFVPSKHYEFKQSKFVFFKAEKFNDNGLFGYVENEINLMLDSKGSIITCKL